MGGSARFAGQRTRDWNSDETSRRLLTLLGAPPLPLDGSTQPSTGDMTRRPQAIRGVVAILDVNGGGGLLCDDYGSGLDEGLVRLLGAAGPRDCLPVIMGSHEDPGGRG
jgi:hypothetical protein